MKEDKKKMKKSKTLVANCYASTRLFDVFTPIQM